MPESKPRSYAKDNEALIDRQLNPEFYETNYKICGNCKANKKLIDFEVGRGSCRNCVNKKHNLRRRNNMAKTLFMSAKSRAKRLNREFTITLKDVEDVWVDVCPVLGIPLFPSVSENKKGFCTYSSYSIDRIDSSKGYVPGNIAVISFRANALKSNASIEELKKVIAWLESKQIKNT